MSQAYPSNLSRAQCEILNDLIPAAKPGDRPRNVEMWDVLNAIFYLLCEGCRWRALPGDFPPWQTVYTYFRTWRIDGTWVKIHDAVRQWLWDGNRRSRCSRDKAKPSNRQSGRASHQWRSSTDFKPKHDRR